MFELAAKHPVPVLVACLIATVVAGFGAAMIEPEVDFVATVPPHAGLEPYQELLQRLDGVQFAAIYMAKDPGAPSLRDPASFDQLIVEQANLRAELERSVGSIDHVLSAEEVVKGSHYMTWKIATAGNPPESTYSVPDDAFYPVVRDRALDESSMDDVLARDGSSALLLIFFDAPADELRQLAGRTDQVLQAWAQNSANHPVTQEHQVSGLLWSRHYTDERNVQDIQSWGLLAAGAAALVLVIVVRRPSNVAIAAVALGASLLWTYGTVGLLGVRVSFLSLFLSPVVAGVGIDHAIHVLHRYEEERRTHPSRDAMVLALQRTGPSVALAALTTAGGLAVLLAIPNPLFAQIGGMAAVGIVLAFLASISIVPALRVLIPDSPRDRRGLTWMAVLVAKARSPVAPAIALVLFLIVGTEAATQTRIESGSAENEFPADDPLLQLQERVEEEYGAFQRGYIIVQGNIASAQALQQIHATTREAQAVHDARKSASITDLLLADEATDAGAVDIGLTALLGPTPANRTEAQRLPQTDAEARQSLDSLFADPLWRNIAPFTITRDYSLAVVAITIDPWDDQSELRLVRDDLVHYASVLQDRLGSAYNVAAGGAPLNRAAVIDQTPWNVAIATGGAAAVVLLVLAVGWSKHGREGFVAAAVAAGVVVAAAATFIALVPLLDAIYGTTGGNNAALNDMFLLGLAVVVAVGVDDVVHLSGRYWEARSAGFTRLGAMQESAAQAGRAVLGTTATTSVSFAVLAGSYFLQSKNLAILTALSIVFALAFSLLLLPWALAKRQTGQQD